MKMEYWSNFPGLTGLVKNREKIDDFVYEWSPTTTNIQNNNWSLAVRAVHKLRNAFFTGY